MDEIDWYQTTMAYNRTCDESLIFWHRHSVKKHDCHFIDRGYESPHMMHLENRHLEIWYIYMSYSKTKLGYSLKAAMKMKTSPQHFQWILHGTVPDSRQGVIFNSNYQVLVTCIVKPWPQGGPIRCCNVLTMVIFFSNSCMGFYKTNIWLKLENNFNEKGEDFW